MVILSNHHTHTNFSDGEAGPEEYIYEALKRNLISLGFSDHAPIPSYDLTSIPMEALSSYLETIDKLREKFGADIEIYKSMEVDFIPNVINISSPHIMSSNLDYTIGAVHYVSFLPNGQPWGYEKSHLNFQLGLDQIFDGDIKELIRSYYRLVRKMICDHCPDVLAHMDRIKKLNHGDRYFSQEEIWYRREVLETLHAVKTSGCIMEVNTKGYYKNEIDETYPSKWVLEIANDLQIPVHLSSDAHSPEHIIKGFQFGTALLHEIGYQNLTILKEGLWQEMALAPKPFYAVSDRLHGD